MHVAILERYTHTGVFTKEDYLASWIARGLKKTFTLENIKKMIQSYRDSHRIRELWT